MKEKPLTKDLFVTDIAFEAAEEDLRKLFAVCGTVRSVHLITDRKSGQFKGCAFVNMATAAEAKDAIDCLDGARLLNRCISVTAARPKNAPVPVVEAVDEKPQRARRPRGRRK